MQPSVHKIALIPVWLAVQGRHLKLVSNKPLLSHVQDQGGGRH